MGLIDDQIAAIRNQIAAGDTAPDRLRKVVNKCALGLFAAIPARSPAWREVELIARLLADVAHLLQTPLVKREGEGASPQTPPFTPQKAKRRGV